jgi:predicted Zn-dependent protease
MQQTFTLGIMTTRLSREEDSLFDHVVERVAEHVRDKLAQRLHIDLKIFEFPGPGLTSTRGAYSALDILQLGLSEKLERDIHFLLIIVDADLSAMSRSYVLALPSQMTNIGVLSTRRLSPRFWGYPPDAERTTRRLTALALHTIGHLLNLDHVEDPHNVMFAFQSVDDLDDMHVLTDDQLEKMEEMIPLEAHEEIAERRRLPFALRHTVANVPVILQSIVNTNPLLLTMQLPTVLTAAFSVIIVLFFTAEIWDVASALQFGPLIVFSIIALICSTAVYYSTFKIGPSQGRKGLSESTVVMVSATVVTLLAVNLVLYALFLVVSLIAAVTIFPVELKTTWPTVSAASGFLPQLKLGMFLATMGVLTGSLGGKADSRTVIQQVLFLDEET